MMGNKRKTVLKLSAAVAGMYLFSFLLVPLYDVFCDITGLNGKVAQSTSAESSLTQEGREIGLQFISHNNAGMPWIFKPSKKVSKIKTGTLYEATFYAKNTTDKMMTGRAVNDPVFPFTLPLVKFSTYSSLTLAALSNSLE